MRHRFTTFERAGPRKLIVVQSDGRTEPFDRDKVIAGILAATKGRDVARGRRVAGHRVEAGAARIGAM